MRKMTRTSLLTLLFSVVALWVMAQTKTYTIQSEIDGLESEAFNLTIWNGETRAVSRPNNPMTGGRIFYQDTTSVPLVIRISVPERKLSKPGKRGAYPVKSQHMWLVAMPGAEITLKGHLSDFSAVYPYGDRENDILRELTQRYFPLLNEAVNISVELAREDHGLSEAAVEERKAEHSRISREANAVLMDFLVKHPSSIAGLYFMNDSYIRKWLDTEELASLVDQVGAPYQQTMFYSSLRGRIEADAYQPGKAIFEIQSERTPDGTAFSTAEWAGRFYLIDFWGSWCMPCIRDVPHLKRFREELDGKVNILGIASDTEEKWLKAIEQHELDWQHILIGEGDQNYSLRLNVIGYPTKILVDPNGNIAYRSSGSGEASFRKMAEIVRNWSGE